MLVSQIICGIFVASFLNILFNKNEQKVIAMICKTNYLIFRKKISLPLYKFHNNTFTKSHLILLSLIITERTELTKSHSNKIELNKKIVQTTFKKSLTICLTIVNCKNMFKTRPNYGTIYFDTFRTFITFFYN